MYIIVVILLAILLYKLISTTEYFISGEETCFKYSCPDNFEKNKKKNIVCWKCYWGDNDDK